MTAHSVNPLYIVALSCLFVFCILMMLGRHGGLASLTSVYGTEEKTKNFLCTVDRINTAIDGGSSSYYKNIFNLAVDEQGIYLFPKSYLSFAFRSLFIPWSDIAWMKGGEWFRCKLKPSVAVRFSSLTLRELEKARGSNIAKGI